MGGLWRRLDCSPIGRFYAKFSADRALNGAVQIAWQAMFSSFPLILGLLGLFGLVLEDPRQRRWLAEVNEGVAHPSPRPSAAGPDAKPAAADGSTAASGDDAAVETPAASEPIALPSS